MAIRAMGPSGQYETGLDAAGAALPELLAPAGGLDQMLAAIAAGADAIYAGLGGFNARGAPMALRMTSLRAAAPWRMPMACVCT